jgi:hypothetical protein
MAGGSLGLASSTSSGLDLTNVRPQVTFFRKVFKRHTNFGIESIQQSNFSGTANFGNTIILTIDSFASLITDMHMEFTLPPAAGEGGVDAAGDKIEPKGSSDGVVSNFKEYASWVNAVGYAIIDTIELIIDGNTIDKHTGVWFDIWNELTDPNRKEWPLVGKRLDTEDDPGIIDTKTSYYVPLQFFFNRNPGLALPIFIIGENKLKIKITFNSLINLLNFNVKTSGDATTINTGASISNFKFFTTYIYLEEEEETRIRNALPAEYLIETITRTGPVSSSSTISNIQFENPTKEFIWVFRHIGRIVGPTLSGSNVTSSSVPSYNKPETDQIQPNDIFNYSNIEINETLDIGSFDTFSSLTLQIRNQNRFDDTESPFFRTLQPYKHHSNIPGGIERSSKKQFIYVYSFALNPEEYQPSGSYNFGRLNDRTTFQFTGHDFSNFKLELFSVKYEYLIITSNNVTISSVPTQTYVESSLEVTGGGGGGGGGTAAETKAKTGKAVASEIKKRYTAEIPHLHVHEHAHIHKKSWSGLQGDIMKKKKNYDLGK